MKITILTLVTVCLIGCGSGPEPEELVPVDKRASAAQKGNVSLEPPAPVQSGAGLSANPGGNL
ncbi:MAG: hypothetical protein EOO38_24110 [Cytophagaceae bacterium]|nr:MAG: hypothetical protein EOO38_24110 [Cytophagaceae bacterium]